jgi:AraC family transcriptional regulator of adaptative response/methylated-DNA-[protein]-cysteine methyltransferase
VLHPGLESHPQHDLARRQMRGFGGTFAFRLKGGRREAFALLGNVKLFTLAESLGGVESLIEHPATMPELPIDVAGTAFQEAVWRELRRIPSGETRSYAQIAAAIGQPKAGRAVGTANGDNHVAVLIPCHRVIRSDGTLGGYAGGLDRKRQLLAAEGHRSASPELPLVD